MARHMDLKNRRQFKFTRNWFRNRNLATFREYVYPEWQGKPIRYLEVGVFEGMSMIWMCQYVLTHPVSHAIGIDPWLITRLIDGDYMEDVMQRAHDNLKDFPVTLQRGNSYEVLRRMNTKEGFLGIRKNTVDICMIDGNHFAPGVLDDLRMVCPLIKQGGWLLMDDVVNQIPKKDYVEHGLKLFLEEGGRIERVWKHRFMEGFVKL